MDPQIARHTRVDVSPVRRNHWLTGDGEGIRREGAECRLEGDVAVVVGEKAAVRAAEEVDVERQVQQVGRAVVIRGQELGAEAFFADAEIKQRNGLRRTDE
ncbi:MAG: hypothetical protein Q8O08_12055 [Methyloversatilis sp.]|nr:hypothetical protein [Methyloversatilis sp.]MDP2869553.1 hypothetical protein [Methyloversatilis sp.]MDP3456114.1 hypothetical protein [Methyloversatilis sp.]MDP3577367.1 hypothetical protein [Methyloversatilis sp.]